MTALHPIYADRSKNGAWTRETLAKYGVPWPPPPGWLTIVTRPTGAKSKSQIMRHVSRKIGQWVARRQTAEIVASRMGVACPPSKAAQYVLMGLFLDDRYKHLWTPKERREKRDRVFMAPRVGAAPVESDDFLLTYEWRKLRMEVIKERGATCECCGANPKKHGTRINVDHIKPRRKYPALALEKSNLQILCAECNHGKGNWDETDWRSGDFGDNNPLTGNS